MDGNTCRQEDEKRLEQLKTTIGEQEGRLHNLQSTAFQLANYYFVFQGVILTAISSGVTSLRCSDSRFLFTLSLLATILNFVALCMIALKYTRTKAQQDDNWFECNELERGSRTPPANPPSQPPRTQYSDSCKQLKRLLLFTACILIFLGFAAITLYGCWHIICRKDRQLQNDKCIKLCQGHKCFRVCSDF